MENSLGIAWEQEKTMQNAMHRCVSAVSAREFSTAPTGRKTAGRDRSFEDGGKAGDDNYWLSLGRGPMRGSGGWDAVDYILLALVVVLAAAEVSFFMWLFGFAIFW